MIGSWLLARVARSPTGWTEFLASTLVRSFACALAVSMQCTKCLSDGHVSLIIDVHTIAGTEQPCPRYCVSQNCHNYCTLNCSHWMLLQTVDYVLHCPLCKENCAHALYIYQFDPSSDDCCYFSCVGCISKLRTKVGVPAACWERWDESKVAKHSERSWYPCTSNTQAIMETVKSTKKRKRKAIKKNQKNIYCCRNWCWWYWRTGRENLPVYRQHRNESARD